MFNALIIRSDSVRKIVIFFAFKSGRGATRCGDDFLLTLKIITSGDFESGEKIVILHRF